MTGFAIQGDRLNGTVRLQQDGAAGRFVATTGFHADVAVFNDVGAADPVLATDGVQRFQHGRRRQCFAVERNRITVGKAQLDIARLVRRRFRADRPAPHVFFALAGRVLKDAAFVADMKQISVHGVGALFAAFHVHCDVVLFAVGHQLFTAVQVPVTPGRNHLDAGRKGIGAQLKANLIVALARGAMTDGIGPGLGSDFDQTLGNQRTRNRGTQQVFAFVDGVGAEHGINVITNKVFTQVFDVDLFDAQRFRLGACRLDFLALTDVSGEGHHLTLVGFLKPFDDDRGIQTA